MRFFRSLKVLMFVVALASLAVSQAHAACTGSDEIAAGQAQCLTHAKGVDSWYIATNCSEYGEVAAKVVYSSGTANHTLTSASPRTNLSGAASVYCCKDLGDLCNRSDVVTPSNCRTQFESSDANDSCDLLGDPTVTNNHTKCSFSAECGEDNQTITAAVAYTSMDDLNYCPGGLVQDAECPQE